MSHIQTRVRRVVPASLEYLTPRRASFACAYEVHVAPGDMRSSEEWARAIWEDGPLALRWFMTLGWRWLLGLRLGPRQSPNHILGWNIAERGPDRTVCQAQSWFLSTYNTFVRRDDQLVWSTYVFYDRPIARLVWPPASLVHLPIVRISLALAQRRR